MRVQIGDETYYVDWAYQRPDLDGFAVWHPAHVRAPEKPVTVCRISMLSKGEGAKHVMISGGAALMNPNDNFNKETGRKISLTRALENWSREERTLFWEAYHARKPKKEGEYKALPVEVGRTPSGVSNLNSAPHYAEQATAAAGMQAAVLDAARKAGHTVIGEEILIKDTGQTHV